MARKIEVDNVRGFAYIGRKGYIIMIDDNGLYILYKNTPLYLTAKNVKYITNIY